MPLLLNSKATKALEKLVASGSDANILQSVIDRIDLAIARQRPLEWIFIGILVALFVAGIVLTIIGLASGKWECFVPGGLFEVAVAWPITQIRKLRDTNIRLQILPSMIAMAQTEEAKKLTFDLIKRLIQQV